MNKDGFTLLELLICLNIVVILMSLFPNNEVSVDFNLYHFLNDYYKNQMLAISERKIQIYEDYRYISFNEKGNVQKGQTLHFKNHKVYVHLGNGSLRYE